MMITKKMMDISYLVPCLAHKNSLLPQSPSTHRHTQQGAQQILVEQTADLSFLEKAPPFISKKLASDVGWSCRWGCHL